MVQIVFTVYLLIYNSSFLMLKLRGIACFDCLPYLSVGMCDPSTLYCCHHALPYFILFFSPSFSGNILQYTYQRCEVIGDIHNVDVLYQFSTQLIWLPSVASS